MKLHVDTHPWLVRARVLVDDLDVSAQCRGVDLETRTLYMLAPPDLEQPLRKMPDLVVKLEATERLRLVLNGYELVPEATMDCTTNNGWLIDGLECAVDGAPACYRHLADQTLAKGGGG